MSISPPWRAIAPDTGDHSSVGRKLATVVANPSRIIKIVPHLRDSITTMTRTARTSVSATVRAIGSPVAASGAATKIAQSSRTSRTVRLGSLIRSCQPGIDLLLLSTTIEGRLPPFIRPAFPSHQKSFPLGRDLEGAAPPD